jgi:hypothetical protein
MWFSDYGLGTLNLSPSGTGFNILLLAAIENFLGNQIANFALIYAIFFFPFLAVFLLSKEMKATPVLSFMISFFYTFNPFMSIYLQSLNQWNAFSATAIPMLFWIIARYYRHNFKLFFYYGLMSLLLSYANTNYPMMAIIQISAVISLIIVAFYLNSVVSLKEILVKYGIIMVAFFLFNAWWLSTIPLVLPAAGKIYSRSVATGWLSTVSHNPGASMFKIFTLAFGFTDESSYNFFYYWHSISMVKVILMIPIIIFVYFLFFYKGEIKKIGFLRKIFLLLLILMFLSRGNSAPFGFIYNIMFRFVPFFYIFKSPVEKFGLLYDFTFSVLLMLLLLGLKDKKIHLRLRALLIIYLCCCSIPLVSGHLIPDYTVATLGYSSRKYKDKPEYVHFRKLLSDDTNNYRVLSLPGVGNYQVCLKNYNGKFYTGIDPLFMNASKPYISLEHNIPMLYSSIASDHYKKLFGIYNIGMLVINEDQIPWFGTIGPNDPEELKNIFGKYMTQQKMGSLTIFNNGEDFLPRIYTAGYDHE